MQDELDFAGLGEFKDDLASEPEETEPVVDEPAAGRKEEHMTKEEADFYVFRHTPKGGEITNAFIRHAIQMKRRGFSHYSPWGIIGYIRYHYAFTHGPDETGYLINNKWIAHLSRFAMKRAPKDLEGFFETRKMGGSDEGRDRKILR